MHNTRPNGLYEYQEKIAHLIKDSNKIINLEMRMGKTVIACYACGFSKLNTIVICPVAVKEHWTKENKKWNKHHDLFEVWTFSDLATNQGQIKLKNKLKSFQRIIIDESHRLRNTKRKACSFINLRVLNSKHWIRKWFITATPIINEPLDLYISLRNCLPVNMTKQQFLKSFYRCEYNYFSDFPVPTEFINDDFFIKLIQKCMIRADFDSVGINRKYPMVFKTLLSKETHTLDSKKELIQSLPDISLAKTEALKKELIQEIKNANRTIIFYHYKNAGDRLMKILDKAEYKLDGATPKKQRLQAIENFRNDPVNNTAMLLSITAFSEGINLSFCDKIILFDSTWSGFQDLQAIARCDSIIRNSPKTVIRCFSEEEHKHYLASKKLEYEKRVLNWRTII